MNIDEVKRLVKTRRYYFAYKLIKDVYCLNYEEARYKNEHLFCDLDCEKCPFLVMISEDGKEYQRNIEAVK
jgi:hypothetical protein